MRDRHGGAPALAAVDDQVHALGEPDRRSRRRILEAPHAVEPRPRCVDDRTGANRNDRPVDVHFGAGRVNRHHLGVVQDDRAAIGGRAHVRKRQPTVVRPRVGVQRRGMEALGAQLRNEPQRARLADASVQLRPRKGRVEQDAGAHEPRPVRPVGIQREDERQSVHEMRCDDVHQRAPLLVRLAHETDVAHLEIPEAAVDQLRRCARRRGREVAALDERHVEPMRACSLSDPGADDAAADHQQVERPRSELGDGCYAIHRAFVHAFVPSAAAISTRPYGCRKGRSSRTAVISPASSRSRISPLLG